MSKVIVTTAVTTSGHALPLGPIFLIWGDGEKYGQIIYCHPPSFLGLAEFRLGNPGSTTGNGSRSYAGGAGEGLSANMKYDGRLWGGVGLVFLASPPVRQGHDLHRRSVGFIGFIKQTTESSYFHGNRISLVM